MNDTSKLIMNKHEVKDELLSGGISNVVLHPQDMKRIGLIDQKNNNVDIQKYTSGKSSNLGRK